MYKRILLKLSGEAISSENSPFDSEVLAGIANVLKRVTENGTQVAIVVGGGNIMRGKFASSMNFPRIEADQMGMLGTVINALAIKGACQRAGVKAIVQSAVEMPRVADVANARKAMQALDDGYVVIFGGGTGNPYFSTDAGAALRASETQCEAILMAKNGVDGVYTADPDKDPTATKIDELTYSEMIDKNLKVIDTTASSLMLDADNNIQTIVFSMNDLENIVKVCAGEKLGTVIRR